jgi:hypothetical protein
VPVDADAPPIVGSTEGPVESYLEWVAPGLAIPDPLRLPVPQPR